jgi:hypothetical protein
VPAPECQEAGGVGSTPGDAAKKSNRRPKAYSTIPLRHIRDAANVEMAMKNGTLYRVPELMAPFSK